MLALNRILEGGNVLLPSYIIWYKRLCSDPSAAAAATPATATVAAASGWSNGTSPKIKSKFECLYLTNVH